MVDQAELFLIQLGFRQVRVRHHGEIARIEVSAKEMLQLVEVAEMVADKLRAIGYRYVTVDLQGYRSGSLNESLPEVSVMAH